MNLETLGVLYLLVPICLVLLCPRENDFGHCLYSKSMKIRSLGKSQTQISVFPALGISLNLCSAISALQLMLSGSPYRSHQQTQFKAQPGLWVGIMPILEFPICVTFFSRIFPVNFQPLWQFLSSYSTPQGNKTAGFYLNSSCLVQN